MLRCLVVALLLVACGSEHGAPRVRPIAQPDGLPAVRGAAHSSRIANYKIDAHLDVERHAVTATQTLTWTNTGTTPVQTLPFHMYLNGFKNETSLFMRTSRGQMRGAEAATWGWIQVDSVQVAGVELRGAFKAVPPDESVFELTLPAPVAAGATIEVTMKFTSQLPEVWARTGYQGEFHLVAQWFPKIGVRVGERWECQPFHAFNEFFADFGTYDVALTVPNTYVVAATGVLVASLESPGGTRTFTYRAEDVHDFAWMADPYMEMVRAPVKIIDGSTIEVRVWARPAQHAFARRHLEAATGTIEKFSEWFVPYPWSIMTVIDPPPDAMEGAGGMEYPTFVTTGGDTVFARPGIRLPEYVTVHEVGHNWFQGILASNEPLEAWLDEGVNSWADANAMAAMYGGRGNGVDWMGWQADMLALQSAATSDPGRIPTPIASAAAAFVDFATYSDATYMSTMRALRTLEQTVGAKKLAAAVKKYATVWAFKHPTGADLFEVLQTELAVDLSWFTAAFHQVGGVQLDLRTAHCRLGHPTRGVIGDGAQRRIVTSLEAPEGGYACEIVVANMGTVHVPVDIELEFADGGTQRLRWDDRGAPSWERFQFARSTPLVEVRLDPDGKLALANPTELRYRLDGDGAAALRAGAWAASGAQTLMQIVGP